MRVVERDELHEAMLTYEATADGRLTGLDADDRVPFTREEMDVMAENPCEFGYHRFTPTAEELAEWAKEENEAHERGDHWYEGWDGLTCLNGCGYGIG